MSERDTQFQGFARAVSDAIYKTLAEHRIDFTGKVEDYEFDPLVQPIIARAAYDLAKWAYSESDWHMRPPYDSLEEQVARIADMTEWTDTE